MALAEFQRAFADLIASPERCLAARAPASTVFDCYDLTPLETRRIQTMVRDHGMSINCTVYRVNRLTPVYFALPLCCMFLGECLTAELDAFWAASRDVTLQYGREAWRSGLRIQDRIASEVPSPGPAKISSALNSPRSRSGPRPTISMTATRCLIHRSVL
ncbi:MAG: hypothetical protein ABI593_03490 [Betaproteobacteria bacterium]